MACHITISQLVKILGTASPNLSDALLAAPTQGISTDSRSLQCGEVFVALRGEKFDGHQFVNIALQKGAACVIVDFNFSLDLLRENNPSNTPILQVDNTLTAYQKIAHWWRNQFDIPVIGITGSVGKTTTKELIAAVLATQGKVLKTQANYNNEIGVPKTLLELAPDHQYAVIEMAMRGRGEIALLTQIARPTHGIITNVGTAHIGRLGSEAAIAQAKCELLAEMPSDSIAILNHDNQRLMETAATVWSGKTLTFGLTGGNVQGEWVDPQRIKVDGVTLPLPLPGEHNALNYLAALALAQILGISWEPLTQGLSVELPDGRARRYELTNDIILLDETYNAGLESMMAALRLLAQTPGRRRVAVLGTMKELGERSLEFHQQVGVMARQLQLDALFIFADFEEAAAMAMGASGGVSLVEIQDIQKEHSHAALAKRLKEFVQPGDRILFKASHSVELNRVVEQLRIDI